MELAFFSCEIIIYMRTIAFVAADFRFQISAHEIRKEDGQINAQDFVEKSYKIFLSTALS